MKKVKINTTTARKKNNQDTPKEYKNMSVNDKYESKLYKHAYIKDTKNSNRHDTLHTKPITQPKKRL